AAGPDLRKLAARLTFQPQRVIGAHAFSAGMTAAHVQDDPQHRQAFAGRHRTRLVWGGIRSERPGAPRPGAGAFKMARREKGQPAWDRGKWPPAVECASDAWPELYQAWPVPRDALGHHRLRPCAGARRAARSASSLP